MATYDLVVIGSGPAGRRAAVQAAKFGRSVLVVERGQRLGGVSVHTGTIPSKTLRETVLNLTGWRERGFYGQGHRAKKEISAADLKTRLHKTLDHEVEVLRHQFLRNGIQSVTATARFLSPNKLALTNEDGHTSEVLFYRCVIAVGTRPCRPDFVPFDQRQVLDSDEILDLQYLPRSITVIGAGVVGVEYATIFSALDIRVTLIDQRETYLDFVDRDIISEFTHDLRDRGITLRLGSGPTDIRKNGTMVDVTLADGRVVQSDMLLYAAGRTPNTQDLGLEAAGVALDERGKIIVDATTFQTAQPSIYAAGDVIGFPSLASTSMEQGRTAACHAFRMALPRTPECFPYGIYTVPEISFVGMTEEQVRTARIPHECGIARLRETSRGHIMGVTSGYLKIICSLQTRKLLGIHIVGEGATEMIHIGQAVINLGGTVDYFVNNTFNYPTLAEAYKIAGLDAWNRMNTSPMAKHYMPYAIDDQSVPIESHNAPEVRDALSPA